MAIAKRVVLFLLLNFLIMLTLSIIVSVLGIQPYLAQNGIDYVSLAEFCIVWGMGGALISLMLSRVMAKWMMGVRLIDPQTRDPELTRLLEIIYSLCRASGITTMPEVGIYQSSEVNAFATGPTKSRALVAISSGLLGRMNRDEIEGVLGHEISHVANGDMVTMALLQGMVNAFVLFLSRVIAYIVARAARGNEEREGGFSYGLYTLVEFVLQIAFMILGAILIAAFSRYREYRADRGGALIAGREKMLGALVALERTYDVVDPTANPSVQNMKISGSGRGIFRLFSTHPPLEERIERIRAMG